jgi:hypothetical protein
VFTSDTIEDKYLLYDCADNVCISSSERFTHNYFEYEEGQKEIIVKDRLKRNIDFWREIGANSFVLDTIMHGYKIPLYSMPNNTVLKNN